MMLLGFVCVIFYGGFVFSQHNCNYIDGISSLLGKERWGEDYSKTHRKRSIHFVRGHNSKFLALTHAILCYLGLGKKTNKKCSSMENLHLNDYL